MSSPSLSCAIAGLLPFCRSLPWLLLVAPVAGHAADVYWQPRVQAAAGYDDNFRLVYDIPGQDVQESALYQAQVEGELGVDAGTAKSVIFGRYWYQSVASNDDYDADIAQVRWNFLNTAERALLTADIDVQYDTTLTSEFENSGINEKKDRHFVRSRLGYRWQLTPRDYVGGDYGADSARYMDAENTALSDYDTQSATLNYGHGISERTNIGLQVVYSEFDIPQIGSNEPGVTRSYETHNLIAMLFGDYALGEHEKLSLQAGFRTSNFYNEIALDGLGSYLTREEGNGQVYSASYTRKFDRGSLLLSASRDLRPNGAGTVIEQDSVNVAVQRALTEVLTLNMSASANQQREPAGSAIESAANYERDFAQVVVGLRYMASEQHVLAVELNGRRQRQQRDDTIEADSTAVYLRWYWNPPHMSF